MTPQTPRRAVPSTWCVRSFTPFLAFLKVAQAAKPAGRGAHSLSSVSQLSCWRCCRAPAGGLQRRRQQGAQRGGMSHLGLQLNSSRHGRQALPVGLSPFIHLRTGSGSGGGSGSSSKGRERGGWQALVQIDQWSPIPPSSKFHHLGSWHGAGTCGRAAAAAAAAARGASAAACRTSRCSGRRRCRRRRLRCQRAFR